MQTQEQVGAAAPRQSWSFLQLRVAVARAGEDNLKAESGECSPEFLREEERIFFFLVRAFAVAWVLAAMSGVQANGGDALAGRVFGWQQHWIDRGSEVAGGDIGNAI